MPFREKTAWFLLISLLVNVAIFLFLRVSGHLDSDWSTLHFFLLMLIASVVAQFVLRFIAARMAPKDARAPVDERERLIALKAARNAGAILIVGVLAVPFSLHLGVRSAPDMGYLAIVALAVSEIVRTVSKIVYYRLGR
jgi:hypothetical protein